MVTTHDFDCSTGDTGFMRWNPKPDPVTKVMVDANCSNKAVLLSKDQAKYMREMLNALHVDVVTKGVLTPKRILRSGPATIVFWVDGTKTIVKRAPDEEDNEYAAFTAALAIRIFGSNSKVKKIVKTKLEEQK